MIPQTQKERADKSDTPFQVTTQRSSAGSDIAKDSEAASNGQRHSLDAVGVGIDRFLAEFRESFGTDMEAELTELGLCKACGLYPAAWMQRCFSCNASHRLPPC